MSYSLGGSFRLDAQGRLLPLEPSQCMDAAARYYSARNYTGAERCCRELIARDPRHFDALHLLGVVCLDQSQLSDAVGYLTRAANERASDALVQYHLGTAYLGLKQYERAEAALRYATAERPDDPNAHNNLANALIGLQHYEEAIASCRRVLELQPGQTAARYNLGRALAASDRPEAALHSFRTALAGIPHDIDPDRLADIHAALGDVLVALGRHDEALAACRAIGTINPAVAAWNESLILLRLGRYREGWLKYEGRWQVKHHDAPRDDARVPDLRDIDGKHVLLVPEQGHGDLIQFARYAPLLAAKGAQVNMQTYAELKPLMQMLGGVDTVVTTGEPEPAADIVTPLLSLPLVFGTELATVPARVPYFTVPSGSEAKWRERLGEQGRPRIGLAWWGSQHIPRRSLPLAALSQLLALNGLEFHSLQKEIPPEHETVLAASKLIDHREALTDYAETAALISLLDLVVTIDTSVAHLAGALGKPVWIMLRHNADWRWLLDRDDSPWYPTARLFRQKLPGDWDSVIADVERRLAEEFRQPQAPART